MKKFIVLLSALAVFTSCDWFVFDNQAQYDAEVKGSIKDAATGELVQFGNNPCTITIVQDDYIAPGHDEVAGEQNQTWNVRYDGVYQNKLVWAGKYHLNCTQNNFYPDNSTKFELKKGKNDGIDFNVTPYARVKNVSYSYNAAEKTVTATCKVELGKADPAVTSVTVQLLGYSDRFVSDNLNKINDASAKVTVTPDELGETITVSCSVESNSNQGLFKYEFDKFFRIGVLVKGNGVNTASRYNFSQVTKAAKGFGSFETVTDWEEK